MPHDTQLQRQAVQDAATSIARTIGCEVRVDTALGFREQVRVTFCRENMYLSVLLDRSMIQEHGSEYLTRVLERAANQFREEWNRNHLIQSFNASTSRWVGRESDYSWSLPPGPVVRETPQPLTIFQQLTQDTLIDSLESMGVTVEPPAKPTPAKLKPTTVKTKNLYDHLLIEEDSL